jgi:hypothetical protein
MKLSDAQQRFVDCFIANSGNAKLAAETAGYSHPNSEGWRLINTPSVAEAVRKATLRLARHSGAVGMQTLISIAQDENAPSSARVNAAIGLCRVSGLLGNDAIAAQAEETETGTNASGINYKLLLERVSIIAHSDTQQLPIILDQAGQALL